MRNFDDFRLWLKMHERAHKAVGLDTRFPREITPDNALEFERIYTETYKQIKELLK